MLKVEGREINLYQLHYDVMSQDGFRINVTDQCPVIPGRLGFVNFPGNSHEPTKSGPGIAMHIEQVYKPCLQDFDSLYLRQLFHQRRLMILRVNGGDMSAGPSGATAPQGLSDIKDPRALSEIISYVALSAPELRARGVPNHIITLLEKHRDQPKATLQQHHDFAKKIQIAAQGQLHKFSKLCDSKHERERNAPPPCQQDERGKLSELTNALRHHGLRRR
ncbi:hypothetical protein DICSQDRAFT_49630 [Dichomitus squalens LYAD-421 SS1]|uniref:uncharacterized protein n=1 Tax=Dichomitus squalens (strain LYAD-421) TaxID=732165 RepID=UPI0004415939|nr:uncharacterized protein DICSQDRAFT_49630 [Dichomitus squalens LYAD-421 SS1]EJF66370.1 hypothetical protein DICSQDRAFT_49630 [Dichomitus squalens LYAD-421 SS1]